MQVGLQKSLQQELQFVQVVVKDSGDSFSDVEEALQSFPNYLFDDFFDDDDSRQKLATFHVKFAGLAIPGPITSSNPKYEASSLMCSHLIVAIHGTCEFCTWDHKEIIWEVKAELTCNNARHETALITLASK